MVSAVCLFEDDMLSLDRPQIGRTAPNGKVLLVWGGSSSLGSCAIQQALAAGYEVAAVAGKHNFAYCQGLGAQHVFDHKEDNVVEQVVQALGGKNFAGAFCAIFAEGVVGKCARIANELGGNRFVSVIYPPGLPVPDEIPEGVRIGQCEFLSTIRKHNDKADILVARLACWACGQRGCEGDLWRLATWSFGQWNNAMPTRAGNCWSWS